MKAEPRDRVSAGDLARIQDELRRRGMLDPNGEPLIHEWPEEERLRRRPQQAALPLDREPGSDG